MAPVTHDSGRCFTIISIFVALPGAQNQGHRHGDGRQARPIYHHAPQGVSVFSANGPVGSGQRPVATAQLVVYRSARPLCAVPYFFGAVVGIVQTSPLLFLLGRCRGLPPLPCHLPLRAPLQLVYGRPEWRGSTAPAGLWPPSAIRPSGGRRERGSTAPTSLQPPPALWPPAGGEEGGGAPRKLVTGLWTLSDPRPPGG